MLIKVLPFLLVVGTLAYDPTIYHNCTQTELCSSNRGLERQDRFQTGIEGFAFGGGEATFRLQSLDPDTDDLLLKITTVEGEIFRVQIEEEVSPRYHLLDVLDGEPEIIDFDDVLIATDSIDIILGEKVARVLFSPFSIEILNGNSTVVVIEGDQLTLNIEELHNPFTVGIKFPDAAHLYGLHEHADHLALRTTAPGDADPYRIKTMDLTNYELWMTLAMYGAIPVLYGHGVVSTAGIFWHNAAEQWVEITNTDDEGAEAFFMIDSGAFDLFVLPGPTIVDVVRQYTSLTGHGHLPPIWTLGYHQCRWGYADIQDVETVIADLDAGDFPVDVIWLDIQHTQDYKFFTWNSENFSDPFGMLENLASTDRYLVTLSDPHFKKEVGYFVYDHALANDFFIKNPDGTVFEDECWPGTSSWMDYLNPDARDYYSSLYLYENWNGTTSTLGGIWNDMNEAAIFDEPNEKTFPYDVTHYGGVSNRDIHNMYGYLQTMATHKGLIDRDNGTLRPFILTRAHFAGSQRFAAIWTGDNTAEFGYIPVSFAMCLNANLLGIVFCGADIGGFFDEPTEELLQRFYQSGAWLPFFREHANIGSERREPYLYPDNVQDVIRQTIKTRYAHLPVWYTLFYEHVRTGDPVIRPLFYHYPEDTEAFEIDDQLLVGSDILVKAVGESGVDSVPVYFPGGENLLWFSAELDGTYYNGTGWADIPVTIERIPVYYRAGSVIATKQTPRPTTTAMKNDGHTLYVVFNEQYSATGTVYIDDTLSFEYQNSQKYNYVRIDARGPTVLISSIDDSDSGEFDLRLEDIVTVEVTEGRFLKKTYKYNSNGVALRQFSFKGKEPLVIHLE